MEDKKLSQAGFALLVSLIVVSVVVSIGLVLLDVTIKQLRLSSNSTDSELAFHAANAGIECARYWRRVQANRIEGNEFTSPVENAGRSISAVLECFGSAEDAYSDGALVVDDTGDGNAFLYEYEFDWASGDRCAEIDMVVAVASVFGDGVEVGAGVMAVAIPGYPAGQVLDCPAGSFCTVISSKGYNRSCDQKNSFGTVQREVLLEL